MATNRPLPGDITVTGMDQKSLYQWMANITDAVNELMDDHATQIALTAANKTAVNAIIAAAGSSLAAIAAVTAVTASPAATLSDTTDITLLRS